MKLDKFMNKKILVKLGIFELLRGFSFLLFAVFLTSIVTAEIESFKIFWLFVGLSLNASATFCINRLTKQFSNELQTQTRQKIHSAMFEIESVDVGKILTLTTETVSKIDLLVTKILPLAASAIILMPMILIVALIFDPITAGIFLITLPVSPAILSLIGKVTREKSEHAWFRLNQLNREFHELLAGILTLKIFKQTSKAESKLVATSEKSSAATLEILKLAFISAFAVELITTLSIAIVAVTVGLRLLADDVSFFVAFFILVITPEFFAPIRASGIIFHSLVEFKTAVDELEKFFKLVPKSTTGLIIQTQMPPVIKVDHLSFKYKGKKFFVLNDLSVEFKPNQITIVTGYTGSGKSTLLKLLAGFFSPTNGKIFWNELDLLKIDRHSIFSKIAYVPQFPKLFDGTLRDNLTMFGSYELNLELIQRLGFSVDLLDYKVNSLSNGELSRLGLARALLKDSKIMLLDEPTANLDSKTEQIILDLISEMKYFRTIIISSHRESVINFADEVIRI